MGRPGGRRPESPDQDQEGTDHDDALLRPANLATARSGEGTGFPATHVLARLASRPQPAVHAAASFLPRASRDSFDSRARQLVTSTFRFSASSPLLPLRRTRTSRARRSPGRRSSTSRNVGGDLSRRFRSWHGTLVWRSLPVLDIEERRPASITSMLFCPILCWWLCSGCGVGLSCWCFGMSLPSLFRGRLGNCPAC